MIWTIYKITYPNGKIYIGQDRTNDINYFGSAKSHLIEQDLHEDRNELCIRKEIIYETENNSIKDLNKKEFELIRFYKSNHPAIGYNQRPKHESN